MTSARGPNPGTKFVLRTDGGAYYVSSILQMKKGLENSCNFTLTGPIIGGSEPLHSLVLTARYYGGPNVAYYHVTNMERRRILKEIAKLGL
jgi:hypothetical protein